MLAQEPAKILIKTISGIKKGSKNISPQPKSNDPKTRKVIEELTIQGKKISAINSSHSGSPTPKGFKDSAITKTQPSIDKQAALNESPNSKLMGSLQVEKIKVTDSRDMANESPIKGMKQPATPVDSILTRIEDENEESQHHVGDAANKVAEFKLENDQVNIGEHANDDNDNQEDPLKEFQLQTMDKGDSTFSDGGSKAQLKPRSPGRD